MEMSTGEIGTQTTTRDADMTKVETNGSRFGGHRLSGAGPYGMFGRRGGGRAPQTDQYCVAVDSNHSPDFIPVWFVDALPLSSPSI